MSERGNTPAAEGQWTALRGTSPRQRRALLSGWAGFFVDMVDVYLPVVALAPAIGYFQPNHLTGSRAGMLFFLTFAATLLGRPVGAALFGHLADTVGRRRVTSVSIAGFSTCTIAIGLLPGYATWGLTAAVMLVALRFVDGVFLGGEYTAATPLAFEHCPPAARGLYGGLLMGAYAFAYATVSALVLVLLVVLPEGAYEAWGWRVPFLVGGLAGFGFLGYRARVPESPLWQATMSRGQGEPRPIRTVVLGKGRRDFAQVLLLMAGLWLLGSSVISVLPVLLLTELQRPAVWVTGVLLLAQFALIGAFLGTGAAGQRWGRRRTIAAGAGLSATAGLVVYAVIVTAPLPAWLLAVGVVTTEVLVLAVWGAVIAYVTERFATAVRASGFGLGYSLALVPASFYAFYLDALANVMPVHLTQLVLLAVGGALAALGALLGPETRSLDLAQAGVVPRRSDADERNVPSYSESGR